ncbi:MAG TPA: hypothetical protein PL157_05920 [Acidobacteriota bacterium]|nr:hypothetical protein [Acidobacteriota bacterium]
MSRCLRILGPIFLIVTMSSCSMLAKKGEPASPSGESTGKKTGSETKKDTGTKNEAAPDVTIQSPPSLPGKFDKIFTGTINGDLKIKMTISRDGSSVVGNYLYEKYQKNIRLQGEVKPNGAFRADEFGEQDLVTGTFNGVFLNENIIVGYWEGVEGQKQMPFQVIETGKETPTNVAIASKYKLEMVNCAVKNDSGNCTLAFQNGKLYSFQYGNLGANDHSCGIGAARNEDNINWEDTNSTSKITYTQQYFDEEKTYTVVFEQSADQYTLTFGDEHESYFCGMRATLPKKVIVKKIGTTYTGSAVLGY